MNGFYMKSSTGFTFIKFKNPFKTYKIVAKATSTILLIRNLENKIHS